MTIKKTSEKKKAPDGTGMVRQRSENSWEGRVYIGYDQFGKRIRKSVYGKTQKEVVEKMTLLKAQVISGTYIAPSKITVAGWINLWIETYCSDIKKTTIISYKKNIKNHIIPCLGKKLLNKLSPTDIQRFYNSLLDGTSKTIIKPLSPKTVRNIHGVLHKCLSQAVYDGHLSSNPADNRTFKKIDKTNISVLEPEEISIFLNAAANDPYADLFRFVLFTGLRLSEVIGLTWDCVDFNEGNIHVYRQLQYIESEYIWSSLKSSKPRTINPAKAVMDLLIQIKEKQNKTKLEIGPIWKNHENFVFTGETGNHCTHPNIRKHLKDIAASIGKPEFRFHDLRHTYASTSLYAGDDIKVVQENLGHFSAAFTMDTYAHITKKIQQASSERMQSFIENNL